MKRIKWKVYPYIDTKCWRINVRVTREKGTCRPIESFMQRCTKYRMSYEQKFKRFNGFLLFLFFHLHRRSSLTFVEGNEIPNRNHRASFHLFNSKRLNTYNYSYDFSHFIHAVAFLLSLRFRSIVPETFEKSNEFDIEVRISLGIKFPIKILFTRKYRHEIQNSVSAFGARCFW